MNIVISVQGSIKPYHWGNLGDDSYIAKFLPANHALRNENIVGNKWCLPLAEIWFGAHPSGPSTVEIHGKTQGMEIFLKNNPEFVGDVNRFQKFGKTLPFLFKILSVAQPLSLQAHPDKELAEKLRLKDPKNYPDSNHKPELAIALTEFDVLCDFRPMLEIINFAKNVKPFRRIIGEKLSNELIGLHKGSNGQHKIILAECFKNLMVCSDQIIIRETKNLLLNHEDTRSINHELIKLIQHLASLYPGDPGIFAPFFLNHIKLAPGQAIFLKARKLHAYIKGDCIECMACSDNVVRAGLTSKFRDVETLIQMLDYECVNSPQDLLFPAVKNNHLDSLKTFAPVADFQVDVFKVKPDEISQGTYKIPATSSGSFIVFIQGDALAENFFDKDTLCACHPGTSWFVPAQTCVKLTGIKSKLIFYRAHC